MNLFDDTVNKYYDLCAYLLNHKASYTKNEINRIIDERLSGINDYEISDLLFASKEGEELIFDCQDKIQGIIPEEFPVRNSIIENQAAKSLLDNKYIEYFLDKTTIDKLRMATKDIKKEWSPGDITVKNLCDTTLEKQPSQYRRDLSVIAQAIKERRAISYEYDRETVGTVISGSIYPVIIEFSIANDIFRICAYFEEEDRFIKMNLDNIKNIKLLDKYTDRDLKEYHREFIKKNTKKVVLDVDSRKNIIERCFRVFSYYDRIAKYDKEENKYILEINYMAADESEVIKNILTLGGSVFVMEPKAIQDQVYSRLLAMKNLYD